MDKDISIIVNARVESTRISRKLVRPFSNTTLLEIALSKLTKLSDYRCFLACADDEIISLYNEKFAKTNISLIVRSKESVQKGFNDYRVAFGHYKELPTRFFMWMNPCSPFVDIATYNTAIKFFQDNKDIMTMTSVKSSENVFMDDKFSTINIEGKEIRSVKNKKVYEMSHLFHFFDKEYFLRTASFWDYEKGNPYFYEVPREQSFDVDDPIDFVVAEALYDKYGPVIGAEI